MITGVVVILPDYFVHGLYLTGDNSSYFFFPRLIWCFLMGGFQRYPWETSLKVNFDATVNYVVTNYGVSKIGLWGFCWGAYVSFKACGDSSQKHLFVGCVSCHPSVSGLAGVFHENQEEIVEKVICPQLILSTPQEIAEWQPGGMVDKFLQRKSFAVNKVPSQVLRYEQTHGFVTRGDLKDAKVAVDMRGAILRTVDFFKATLN